MAQAYADVAAAQVEAVSPLLTGFWDEEDSLYTKFEKVPSQSQSGRAMRIPIELRPGAVAGGADFDGGSTGNGGGPVFDYAAMTPVEQKLVLEWTLKNKFTTDSESKAIVDTVQRTIASGIKEAKIFVDKTLQTTGTGIAATITAHGSAPTYSVAGNGFGARLLRRGYPVSIYDATQATYRGTVNVTAVDYKNETVTLSGTLAGAITTTDKICFGGLTATPPTFIYGLPYHHNASTAGSWLSWTRSSYPEIITPNVAAGSTNLTIEYVHKLMALMEGELSDVFDSGNWGWYMSPKQHTQLLQLMTQISEISLPMGGGNGEIDLAFNRKRQRMLAQIPVQTSINADQSRIDLIDFQNWMRGTYKDLGFISLGGKTVLPVPNSTSYNFAEMSILGWAHQFACKNPRRGGYISGLTVPF
ncbi:MAG: hypothetical protein IPP07_28770 [Holophagales bacterium]|nr:hypothetical protein [Holophagales bacterium]